MSISCTSTPMASVTTVFTRFPTTTFTNSVITASPTTRAIGTSTTCLGYLTPIPSLSLVNPVCTSNGVVTQFTTIPGGVQTTQVPVVQTIATSYTTSITYYLSSCTTIPTSKVTKATTSTMTTQSETTLNDGRVSTVIMTKTTFLAPSLGSDAEHSSPQGAPVGSIIGGIVGGLVGLLVVAIIIWALTKRRREQWETDSGNNGGMASKSRFSLSAEFDEDEPKPHQDELLHQHIPYHHSPLSEPQTPSSSHPLSQSPWLHNDPPENPFASRAGSPVSFTESQRGRLQVTNRSPSSLYGDTPNANPEDDHVPT